MHSLLSRILVTLVTLALFAGSVAAEERYKIHPGHGALVTTGRHCGDKTRSDLVSMIGLIPVLVIRSDGTWMLQARGLDRPANDVVDHVAWWWFPREEPKEMLHTRELVLSLRAPNKDGSRPLRIAAILRLPDGTDCSESWEGLVIDGQ